MIYDAYSRNKLPESLPQIREQCDSNVFPNTHIRNASRGAIVVRRLTTRLRANAGEGYHLIALSNILRYTSITR